LSEGFTTVYGRNLVGELPNFVHRPYLVVTMADLWPLFSERSTARASAACIWCRPLDVVELDATLAALPTASSVIGVGGGQAIDVAKFIAWRRGCRSSRSRPR
jgi:glycerol dehydrogenase-like iron-containing ADH family enzyme